MSREKSSGFNPNIHGLRGFAALCVFVYHIYSMAKRLDVVPPDAPQALQYVIFSFTCGVDLFFMISGYLITASLIRHANVATFLRDRIIRIYPVFLFLHLALFAMAPVIGYKWTVGLTPLEWIGHFFSNLFLLPGVFDLPLMQLNAWSLSYEFAFYLFSAAICVSWKRQRPVAYALIALAMPTIIWFYPRAIFFAVGTAVYFIAKRPDLFTRVQFPRLGLVCALPFFAIMGYAMSVYPPSLWLWAAAPFGFFLFLDIERGAPVLSPFFSHRVMQFLGTISYSFYLWHPVVSFPLKTLMTKVLIGKLGMSAWPAILIFGAATLIITIIVSYLSWLVLEKHVGGWLRKRVPGNAKRGGTVPMPDATI